jgi:hypothetical protein
MLCWHYGSEKVNSRESASRASWNIPPNESDIDNGMNINSKEEFEALEEVCSYGITARRTPFAKLEHGGSTRYLRRIRKSSGR